MAKRSAGIILFRKIRRQAQLLLVHPGGPFWAKKDDGSWSIPKGLYDESEDPLVAAKRELREETGIIAEGKFLELGTFKQPGGKMIVAWAIESDFDSANLVSNTFLLEWPPKSGKHANFSEVDRASWFSITEAMNKITKGQHPILTTLAAKLNACEFTRPQK
jgi:predicted NUDIX family NTP pyrophosphohydrolase